MHVCCVPKAQVVAVLALALEQLVLELAEHVIDVIERREVGRDAIAAVDEALEQRMRRRDRRGSVGGVRRHRRNDPMGRDAGDERAGAAGTGVTQRCDRSGLMAPPRGSGVGRFSTLSDGRNAGRKRLPTDASQWRRRARSAI